MIVKICGITSLADALAALEAGADMLGFNFYPPSPRYLRPQDCARIQAALQERGLVFQSVGVFVNLPPAGILRIMQACRLDLAQLSGDEPPEHLATLGVRAFKALRPARAADLDQALDAYRPRPGPPAWLIDAHHPGLYGGSGQATDWDLARALGSRFPILLAGGLNPHNVAEAIRQVNPWGVDVASGVESTPGRKDSHKLAAFVVAARRGSQEIN